jgi:hypothetical protein
MIVIESQPSGTLALRNCARLRCLRVTDHITARDLAELHSDSDEPNSRARLVGLDELAP